MYIYKCIVHGLSTITHCQRAQYSSMVKHRLNKKRGHEKSSVPESKPGIETCIPH